jgi:pectinacetylesterase
MRTLLLPLLAILSLSACSSGADPGTTSTTGAGGASSTTTSSTSSATGGAGGATPLDTPLEAKESTWTWVPFHNAFCADGSTTGVGVNLSKKSSRVIVYLEGGGACWNEVTCYTLKTASNFEGGYGPTNFEAETTSADYLAKPGGFFDRAAADNPFKDYSYVYVPYCTGDVHGGDNTVTYGDHTARHVGFKNMSAYLKRIVPTFPSADRVYLAGSSAGGFGAVLNWGQTQQAFGSVRVDLIDDSGTPMPPDIDALGSGAGVEQSKQWNLPAALPPGCADCAKGLDALFGYYAKAFPDHSGVLLSYTLDSVLPTFSGISADQFDTGLEEDLATYFAPNPNLKSFLVDAAGHVLFFNPALATKGVTLNQFLTQMVTDDKAWASVHP